MTAAPEVKPQVKMYCPYPVVSANDGAVMERIDEALNVGEPQAFESFIARDGAFQQDGKRLSHVVFNNVEV